MENKLSALSIINEIFDRFKHSLDPVLTVLLKDYSFEKEVKWRYEGFQNFQYCYNSFGISIIFMNRINEDNYGFDLSFKILNDSHEMSSYIARGNGQIVLNEKKIKLDDISKKIEDLVDEYTGVSVLLIKEYILEYNQNENRISES